MFVERRQVLAGLLATALPWPDQAAAMNQVTSYAAIAMQLTARSIESAPDRETARRLMLQHIEETGGKIRSAAAFVAQYSGLPAKLVVLPEYLLTSFPGRIAIPDFAEKAAIAADGPEYEALARIASSQGLFLAGNAYETDRNFPGLYFQTSFIIGPNGDVVLRYRRLNSMFAPTPHDVWSRYLDIYGIEGVFPVAQTEIGNLAAIASEEILYPEIARAHALRGAELFVHSSSEVGSPLATHKDIAKRARAFENMAYVVSANTAGIQGSAMPAASADGNSAVIDHHGTVLSMSGHGETFTAFAEIDLVSLRAARRRPGMSNYLARQRPALFAPVYATAEFHRPDSLIRDGAVQIPDRDHFVRVQQQVIENLAEDGLI